MNEAHALVDALLHPAVEGLSNTPPIEPAEGEAWLIAAAAQGEWAGREDYFTAYVGSRWLFTTPRIGMRVYRKDTRQFAVFDGVWESVSDLSPPSGGATVDAEARTAIAEVIESLRSAGILAQN